MGTLKHPAVVRFSWFVVSLVATACGPGVTQLGTPLQTLSNHTPSIVGQAHEVGAVSPDMALDLRIALPLREKAALDAFVEAVADPQSPSYQQFLTPQEFVSTYLPDDATIAQVRAALVSNGMTPADETHGVFLSATATAEVAEAFFHTQIKLFEDASGNTFYAPVGAVSVPQGLPVNAVVGLQTAFPPHPTYHLSPTSAAGLLNDGARSNAAIVQNKAAVPALLPSDIRALYSIPAVATGAGQIIGLYELDGYVASDISGFATTTGIAQVPLVNILVDNFSGTVQNPTYQTEVTLDIELANALAQGAQQIRVYEGTPANSLDVFNEMANPTLGDKQLVTVLSTSYAVGETFNPLSYVQSEATIFEQMMAQGQTLFAASGDFGADGVGNNGSEGFVEVNDPASQPFVVAVGGTTLFHTGETYVGEAAWSGSGGGTSAIWTIPSWQKTTINAASGASTTMRNVPDVALNADGNAIPYEVFVRGQVLQVGGTSCASPLWAAFFALANQSRATVSLPPLGFGSPALYYLGEGIHYANDFHDVTSGNNGKFGAVSGLDNVTGWGSFNGANLLDGLSQGFARSTETAPPGFAPTAP